jgi:hypothetical protein
MLQKFVLIRVLDFYIMLYGILFIIEEEEQREALEYMGRALDYLFRMLKSM